MLEVRERANEAMLPTEAVESHAESAEHARCQRIVGEKYQLVRRLGSGGMGVVYQARHCVMGNSVAIKFPNLDPARGGVARRRFLREARATASLQSEHIVRTLDFGEGADGSPFLVLELLRGESLAGVLQQGPLPLPRALHLFAGACRGVATAHAAGIVHRDLKPANLFVHRPRQAEVCKVLDFGLATRFGQEATLTGERTLLGTVHYMAPEQITGDEPVDAKSDVFALGAVLFEMLTGRRVHVAATQQGILYRIVERDADAVIDLAPHLPPCLSEVVARALCRDRARRFSGASTLLNAVEALQLPAPSASSERVGPRSTPAAESTVSRPVPSPWNHRRSPPARSGMAVLVKGFGLAGLAAAGAAVAAARLPSPRGAAAEPVLAAAASSLAPRPPLAAGDNGPPPTHGAAHEPLPAAAAARFGAIPVAPGGAPLLVSEAPAQLAGGARASRAEPSPTREPAPSRVAPKHPPATRPAARPPRQPAVAPSLVPRFDQHNPYARAEPPRQVRSEVKAGR